MAYDYDYFIKEVEKLTKIDLSAYKQNQMKRRIDALISKHKIDGYEAYIKVLKTDQVKYDEFVDYITINVSEFYRNPEQWKFLCAKVFPELVKDFGQTLKIWSAACSTGDEPYSLVMALSDFVPLNKIQIMATDINDQVIEKAKIGLYSEKSIASVPEDKKKEFFTKNGNFYQISDKVKKCVTFKQHNLLKDPYPKDMHLIVCRNVLIYFTEEAKDEVFQKYYNSLAPNGVLFIGSTEQILRYKEMGYKRMDSFFYRK
jgi:chemotaxis protein methyltransferase CheR